MSAPDASPSELTQLLERLRAGDREALDRAWDLLYDELRVLARRQLRGPSQTLNTTALVHEAYLKLADSDAIEVRDRRHFFALAVRVMRQVVVDFARRRAADKRGGGTPPETLDETQIAIGEQAQLVLAIDEALERLGDLGERLVRVFECRFFGGLTEQETADVLAISVRTVQRDWLESKQRLQEILEP